MDLRSAAILNDFCELVRVFGDSVATHKCYACGEVRHYDRDKVCQARGETYAKYGDKGPLAVCCRSEFESQKGGRVGGRVRDSRARGDN